MSLNCWLCPNRFHFAKLQRWSRKSWCPIFYLGLLNYEVVLAWPNPTQHNPWVKPTHVHVWAVRPLCVWPKNAIAVAVCGLWHYIHVNVMCLCLVWQMGMEVYFRKNRRLPQLPSSSLLSQQSLMPSLQSDRRTHLLPCRQVNSVAAHSITQFNRLVYYFSVKSNNLHTRAKEN